MESAVDIGWDDFKKTVVEISRGGEIERELRCAFYAGAAVVAARCGELANHEQEAITHFMENSLETWINEERET